MDLNRPFSDLLISFSLGNIRFVSRPKISARDTLVRRYGENGYGAILTSTEPFIFVTFARSRVVIFILT